MLVRMTLDLQAALVDYGEALEYSPTSVDALYGRAVAHSALQNHQVWLNSSCTCPTAVTTHLSCGRGSKTSVEEA